MGREVTLVAPAARTVSGDSGAIDADDVNGAIQVHVTAESGIDPTLDVFIQTTYDGGTTWVDLAAFTPFVAATGRRVHVLRAPVATAVSTATADFVPTDAALTAGSLISLPIGSSVRVKWVVGGTTPSFTFAVTGYFW